MMKKMSSMLEIKIAQKVTYYALQNCISCVYLFPVISYAKSNQLIDDVEIIMVGNKKEYRKMIKPLIERYFPGQETFSPLIIMNSPDGGMNGIVRPEIVQECANNIIQKINTLGDDTVIDFLDGEYNLELFFQNLLFKMATNLVPNN
ncbi:MAG: hypothetical protein ACFFD4_06385 [Candidatus Odinarchaeota archaeon]